MLETMMTVSEVQAHMRISISTLNRFIHSGKLPSYKVGGRRLFKPSDVEKFIADSLDVVEIIYRDRRPGRPKIKVG